MPFLEKKVLGRKREQGGYGVKKQKDKAEKREMLSGKNPKMRIEKAGDIGKQKEKNAGKNPILFFRRIRFKLIVSFLIPVIFIILLGVVSYQKASTQIIESYETSALQTMSMMNRYLTLSIDMVQSDYKSYMNDDTLQKFYKGLLDNDETHSYIPRQFQDTFNSEVNGNSLIANIYFLSDSQASITTTQTTDSGLLSAYAQTPQGQLVSSDQYKYFLFGNQCEIDDKLATDSSKYGARLAKYFNGAGAIMIVDIDKDVINGALTSLDAGEGSVVGFITCDGYEYLSSLSEVPKEGTAFIGKSYVAKAQESENMSDCFYVENNEYLFIYSRLDSRNAMICALIPRETIIGQTRDIKQLSVILVLAASIVAILLGSVMAGQFGSAIYEMIRKLKKVSEGDLTVEVKTKRKDEFKLLAEGISDMTSHMKKLVSGLKNVNGELTLAAAEMASASDNFLQTSRDIQKEISEIDQGVENLDKESEDSLQQMDSLSGKISEVGENSGQISVLAKGAGNVIGTGMDSVAELKSSTGSTIEITASIIDTVEKLAEKSKSIGTIIETINEIAEQTTLLSLNASIEAARAGEAGRGFAVVAQEIRKLADESIHSAEQIARIVEEIEESTKEAANVAKRAKEIVDGQQKAVSLTTDSFDRIGEQVSGLLKALELINESVTSMEEERSTTLSSITAITAISAQTAAGSSNVYETAKKQLSSIEELDKAAEVLETRAKELSEILEGFRV